ncbi:D-glycero-alpha-D-manno-heptose-1,7-bisphosphate 7-phosphatase [Nibricoccus sp. IMCC34717]|uniref:D-glycero-alpha-D-manno-heptose-1,7-bisphosphate 7-phosphatase n=1 Tax=Nibricoccus sp. IMCC34717 TaxID=3034021 RepID=UPI00384E0F9B
MSSRPAKALFLDRDGTLIIDKHYLADPAGVELLPGVREGLATALERGYRLFLFSNQAGVGRGYFPVEAAHAVNARMEEMLALRRPLFDGVCLATEAPDQPVVYRKPCPRFILESLAAHALDPAQCWMVGDREIDVQAGLNAGIRAAGLTNGKLNRAAWATFGFADLPLFDRFDAFCATLP